MADGKVVISTALDNKGIEKDAQKMHGSLKSQVMKLANEYKKQGMSMSDAMKKAYAELGVAGKQASEQASKSIQSSMGDIGGSVSIAVGKLGGLAKVITGVTATIAAAFGAAAVAITKQAVDAYADYEQLIGGVETLFKDAADKVARYAEDAFYTVGISANEYMETVTSFSASLISSLAGDTEKAADVANMALTDMADNANKMGTPLESIKTAYQGFAKQNYTMLDNLKLGYGGTKTEMERLLKYAQKLTGVKYNINNLADVYNAIHAVQVELGIAGTTAKEAEKTITGSANMTKAAWKNVLAAIAGGGDLDKAINNLVYSVSRYFDNIVPVVERSLAGIGELIEGVAPQLVETVAAALIKAIPSLLNAVYQMIIGLANGIYQGIVALLSGSTKEISKQLNATEELGDNLNGAADGASNLADATEEAGKAAKKSLAPFDEITKLSGKESNTEAGGGVIGGGTSGGAVTLPEGSQTEAEKVAGPIVMVLEKVKEKISELLAPLMNINFRPLMNSLKPLGKAFLDLGETIADALEWAWFEILAPLAEWTIEEAAPAAMDLLSSAFEALNEALEPVSDGLQVLWDDLDPLVTFIEEKFVEALETLRGTFDDLGATFESRGEEIRNIFTGIGQAFTIVWAVLQPVLEAMWTRICTVFESIGTFISDRIAFVIDGLSGLVDFIVGVFTGDWERAWDGLVEAVKAPINSLIGFINLLIAAVVASVNSVIDVVNSLSFDVPSWVPGIGGSTFGFDFDRITAPEIPYLAKGAVLPPNKPFMAVVGDQTHGTNVEAPLTTIQEAVAIVMEDMIRSNIAGHEATVAVLREILEAVLGIHIGDDVIGQAVARHNAKMAIIRGGM